MYELHYFNARVLFIVLISSNRHTRFVTSGCHVAAHYRRRRIKFKGKPVSGYRDDRLIHESPPTSVAKKTVFEKKLKTERLSSVSWKQLRSFKLQACLKNVFGNHAPLPEKSHESEHCLESTQSKPPNLWPETEARFDRNGPAVSAGNDLARHPRTPRAVKIDKTLLALKASLQNRERVTSSLTRTAHHSFEEGQPPFEADFRLKSQTLRLSLSLKGGLWQSSAVAPRAHNPLRADYRCHGLEH